MNVELTTLSGRKLYLDFLCLLENDTLCHIEFQFREAKPADLDRFFNYNITAQARYQKLTDTTLFNFTFKKSKEKTRKIGKSKSFHPEYFYLDEKDIEKTIQKINMKSKLKSKLTSDEEITLMLLCLIPEWKNKVETLKKLSKLLKNKNLFDKTKFEYIQAVIKLEIENLLSKEEQKSIKEEIEMTPQAQRVILQAINEVNAKALYTAEEKGKIEGIKEGKKEGIKEGKKEGKKEGIKEGKKEATEELVRLLREEVDIEILSEKTGLSVEEIQGL